MKYYIDTEFLEGVQDKRIFGIKYGETPPTIDLISIGIVAEDGREYYEVSKDFNLYEAWNRYDLKPDIENGGMKKVYWIRENVFKPIWVDLFIKRGRYPTKSAALLAWNELKDYQKYLYLNLLIRKYGKTNKQIAEDLKQIVSVTNEKHTGTYPNTYAENVEFYGYFADYDWVAFCWLFGKMIDLPKGFPMYCKDLKQIIDEKLDCMITKSKSSLIDATFDRWKFQDGFPKQTNEHHALAYARWNKKLYEFLNKI